MRETEWIRGEEALIHAIPADVIEHDVNEDGECICNPRISGCVAIHHSLAYAVTERDDLD